jgi:hypothetical protein
MGEEISSYPARFSVVAVRLVAVLFHLAFGAPVSQAARGEAGLDHASSDPRVMLLTLPAGPLTCAR